MTDVGDSLRALVARQAIADALYRYCDGIDRLDAAMIRSAYHPDGYDDHGTFRGTVTEFVAYAIPALRDNFVTTSHSISNLRIRIFGDRAAVQSALRAVHVRAGDGSQTVELLGGRYLDRFELRDDWRIAHRRLLLDWSSILTASPLQNQDRYNKGGRMSPSVTLDQLQGIPLNWPDPPS
jgi:hypothetical protein